MWARMSLRVKLTILVVSIVGVASWTFGYFAFHGLLNTLEKTEGLRAVTVAEAVAETVDVGWFARWQADMETIPEYERLRGRATSLVDRDRIKRIAVIRFAGGNRVEHVMNLPADGSEDYKDPGEMEQPQPGDSFLERTPGYHGVKLAAPGAYMGGWAPVFRDGVPIGQVTVAVDVNETQKAMDTAYIAIEVTMLAIILLAGLTAFKFASAFEKTAVTDGLMGIYNHKYFKQRLEQEVEKARRYGQQTTMVLLDIDFFKRVNDTFGHATGDLVLKCLAKWVTESSRTTDVVARYGGEEIAVILPHTGVAGAQEFAERLRLKVSNQVVRDPEEDAEFRVTVSIGVGQWEKGMDMLDLIKHTDAALYHSKHAGRNRVSIYQEELLPEPVQASAASNH